MAASVRQLLAVSALVGECESLVASGDLSDSQERSLRLVLAHTLAAYGFPSRHELDGKPRIFLVHDAESANV
jgi:hypothetical protein